MLLGGDVSTYYTELKSNMYACMYVCMYVRMHVLKDL